MSETAMTMIGIAVAVIVMIIIPMSALSERNIDVAQSSLQTATQEFTDEVSLAGVITLEKKEAFEQKLNAIAGMPVEIEFEIQHIDDNPGKRSTTSQDLIGENLSYSTYTRRSSSKLTI